MAGHTGIYIYIILDNYRAFLLVSNVQKCMGGSVGISKSHKEQQHIGETTTALSPNEIIQMDVWFPGKKGQHLYQDYSKEVS